MFFRKATILPIQADDLDYYWPFVASFLDSALKYTDDEISLAALRSDIADQQRQLWVIKHDDQYIAAVVTMIYTTISGVTIGDITFAGGRDHHLWDHFPEAVEPFMLERGCRFLDISGRRGWVKKYQAKGYREAYVILRKDLQDG